MALTKEEVFEIMGKYYGNAYYRDAIRWNFTREELEETKEILDRVNALGYHFSNLGRLKDDYVDERFLPIMLDYIHRSDCLQAFCHKSYHKYTPKLIEIYKASNDAKYRQDVSSKILLLRNRKYIPLYLEIVNDKNYGQTFDFIMCILCKFKVEGTLQRLLELYEKYPNSWRWVLLAEGWKYRDPAILPYIEPYLTCDDCEYRRMAKKAFEKIPQKRNI